jgi:hypothetical protein
MFNYLKKSFFIFLVLANFTVNAVETLTANEKNPLNEEKIAAQPNFVPLSKEESQELLKNLSEEEKALLNKFLETLAQKLESVKEEPIVTEMFEAFANKYGISWNVTLSVYPCKQDTNNKNLN